MSAPPRPGQGRGEAPRPRSGRHGPGLGVPAEKSLDFFGSGRRLLGLLRPVRGLVALGVLLTVLAVATSVMGPKILGKATDLVFSGIIGRQLPAASSKEQAVAGLRATGQATFADMVAAMDLVPGQGVDFGAVARVLLGVLALYGVSAVLMWLAARAFNVITMRTMYALRRDVQDKIHRLRLSYIDAAGRGDLLSRVTNDIDNLGQSLQQTLSQLLTALMTVLGILGVMLFISPLLTLVALVVIPGTVLLVAVIGKRSQRQFVRQWDRTGELNEQVEEAYTGHELVTVFGRRQEVLAETMRTNDALYEATYRAQFISGTIMPATMFLGNLSYVLVAVVGALRVTAGALTLGEVQAFIQYSRQFTQPLTQVASMANLLQSGVASAERVFDLLDAPEEVPEQVSPVAPATAHGRVVFEHVSFRYEPHVPLIEDLSLVAEPGHTVAIVGPTGAGKTTLVNLVMRFYEIDGGRITLDGIDIRALTRVDLRSRIGMVLQDTWLFGGTIRDNIAYGSPAATEQQIRAAAEATYVDRFVAHLPDGYDTILDDEGANVSAGEKQLITIARAFLSDPSLLILDEATSSVDTRTELLLQEAMGALRAQRTSFVIAHRLSTIRDADLILVMETGRIIEQGTHAELLDSRGAYARLYDAQFQGAVTDPEATAAAPTRGSR